METTEVMSDSIYLGEVMIDDGTIRSTFLIDFLHHRLFDGVLTDQSRREERFAIDAGGLTYR